MQRAADISAEAHCRAMRECRPGRYEYHLESLFSTVLRSTVRAFLPITPLSEWKERLLSSLHGKRCKDAGWRPRPYRRWL